MSAAYMPGLDGVRAAAILLVLGAHLGLDHVLPGAFGVTLFFFLSGYLITRQLAGALEARGRIDFAGFYLRRALRLLPAGLLYVAAAGGLYCAAGGRISTGGWLAAVFNVANWHDLFAGYRSTLPGVRHPFNILWSLSIEEQFYALWPALLLLAWRTRTTVAVLLVLCAAAFLWRGTIFHLCFAPDAPGFCAPPNPNPLWRYNRLYLATDTRIDSLGWGALLAVTERRLGSFLRRPAVVAAGVALLAAGFLLPGPWARHVLRPSLQGIALLPLLPLATGTGAVAAVLAIPPAVLVGRLSYSLYLWHWAALGIADEAAPTGGAAWLAIALPLSFALAALSYWGVEKPMLALRRRAGSHAPGTDFPARTGPRHAAS